MSVPFLKDRLVLKGGTAINLFCADQLLRLSVDLDFSYVGAVDRETMLKEKREIDQVILGLCQSEQYELYQNPRSHAGSWRMDETYLKKKISGACARDKGDGVSRASEIKFRKQSRSLAAELLKNKRNRCLSLSSC